MLMMKLTLFWRTSGNAGKNVRLKITIKFVGEAYKINKAQSFYFGL
jgi:hypothetical protein